jgi:hypothetical protein
MKYFFLLFVTGVLFVGCMPTSNIQLPDIEEPVLINNVIGVNKTVIPADALSLKPVTGEWLDMMTQSSDGYTTTTTTRQKNSVQLNLATRLQANPKRFVANFQIDLTSYFLISGFKNKAVVTGDAFELQK